MSFVLLANMIQYRPLDVGRLPAVRYLDSLESSLLEPGPNATDLGPARPGSLRLGLESWLTCQKLILNLGCEQLSPQCTHQRLSPLPTPEPQTDSLLIPNLSCLQLHLRIHSFAMLPEHSSNTKHSSRGLGMKQWTKQIKILSRNGVYILMRTMTKKSKVYSVLL